MNCYYHNVFYMNSFFKWLFVATVFLGMVVSCSTPKKMTYLMDMQYETPYSANPAPDLTIQPGDVLSILVSSENPLLAAPFNGQSVTSTSTSGGNTAVEYTVDADGNITFPVLGKVRVSGMSTGNIESLIANRISTLGYIKDPVVSVALANFTVTVIGNTGNLVLNANGPSLNLFQAIAKAGGTDEKAKIKDVMVIRTENGERMAYQVNLQEKSLFDSPVYYLRQNDIVYVKPRGISLSSEGSTVMTFVGSGLTLVNIIMNYILWSRR